MDIKTKELVQTEFLAFAMKAFAVLNKGRKLGNDKYLKLLAQTLTRVANGETKRSSSTCRRATSKLSWVQFPCRHGSSRIIHPPRSSS
jgi:hypothetical protein